MEKHEYICIGDKEEIEAVERKIDFGDSEISAVYEKLPAKYQECIADVIFNLMGDQDYFGYNLRAVQKWYKESRVALYQASKTIANSNYNLNLLNYTEGTINKQIDKVKYNGKLVVDTGIFEIIEQLCDYWMISMELLTDGHGEFYAIKDEWLEKFANMEGEDLEEILGKDFNTWTSLKVLKKYENYLHSNNILSVDESIWETKYAVISKSGAYSLFVENKKYQNQLNAIHALINKLCVWFYQEIGVFPKNL